MSRIRGRPRKPRPWTNDVKSVEVKSCADGNLYVYVRWLHERAELGCAPAGVMTRVAFATFCEQAINAALVAQNLTPQAPICKVTMAEWGAASIHMYAPSLPPGEHDLYCEPASTAPYLRAHQP